MQILRAISGPRLTPKQLKAQKYNIGKRPGKVCVCVCGGGVGALEGMGAHDALHCFFSILFFSCKKKKKGGGGG